MAKPTEKEYMKMSGDEYDDDLYTTKVGGKTVVSSTGDNGNAKYENNGLQASTVAVTRDKNGKPDEQVIVFRGSESIGSEDGNQDWGQDLGLNDPNAYMKDSQFTDALDWVQSQIDSGAFSVQDIIDGKVTFTGHSLGGALATYVATMYGGEATVFSAPSPYYMLPPNKRNNNSANKRIKNLFVEGDGIASVPKGVPTLGKRIKIKNSHAAETSAAAMFLAVIVGYSGHERKNFSTKDGKSFERVDGISVDSFGGLVIEGAGVWGATTVRRWISNFRSLESIAMSTISFVKNPGSTLSGAAQGLILVMENFIGVKTNLQDSVPILEEAKKINDDLHSEMKNIFNHNVDIIAGIFGLSAGEVESLGYDVGVDPDSRIDQGAVDQASQFFDQKIERINQLAGKVETAFDDFYATDAKIAQTFN